jgi:hypothetical protein
MTTYWFTLRLDGEAADSEAFSVALYEDGHDCVLSTSAGVVTADFSRDADTLREAVLSAIKSVHQADRTVRVVALEVEGRTIDEVLAA